MKIRKIASARLKDFAKIGTNFPDADFWVIRKGSLDTVGMPVKEYSPEYIGIKITSPDILSSQFLYYAIMNAQNQGYFRAKANGVTNLVNIRVSDIADIQLG